MRISKVEKKKSTRQWIVSYHWPREAYHAFSLTNQQQPADLAGQKRKKKPLQCACCRRWARRSPSASPNEPQEVDDGRWRHARYSRGSGYLFKDDQYLSVTQSCVMFQVSTIRYVCEIWPKTRKCICRYHRLQKIDIESQVVKFQICPWLAPMASWRRAHSNNKCSSASARGINPLFTAGKRLWIWNRDENCGQKDTSTLTSVV